MIPLLHVQWWEWLALIGLTMTMIMVDALMNRGHRTPTFKQAIRAVAMFVAVGIFYGIFIVLMHGGEAGLLYYSAWGVEYSLSIDNVFIWVVILDTFKVPARYRHKLLFLGVFGALVLRFVFILLGSVLINKFGSFVIPILAIIVAYSAYNVYNDDTEAELEEGFAYKLANKALPIKPGTNYGGKFFVTEAVVIPEDAKLPLRTWLKLKIKLKIKKIWVTYLFVAVVVIELVDILFAFDSVPAGLAITTDPYLMFSSNAMALLGLRALYFVIGPLKEKMSWLNEGLAIILGWVAVKLLLTWEFTIGGFHHEGIWHSPIWLSLAIIGVVLTASVLASIYFPKKEGEDDGRLIFNAAVVIQAGHTSREEIGNGLLNNVYADTLAAIATYDTDGDVPVIIARDVPTLDGVDNVYNPRPLDYLLDGARGEVNMTPAVRMALDTLPADEPALITVIGDFQVADREALEALTDELAISGRQVFVKLVFATSDEDGYYELPQSLDDRHTGAQDKVDAIYATHYYGEVGETVRDHFGRELDVLARLIHESKKNSEGNPELVSMD